MTIQGSIQEYYLGTFEMDDYGRYEKLYEQRDPSAKLPVINVEDIQLPYIEINMTGGTLCDLSNKKRFTRVLYVCNEAGKHELYSVKETTTCEYEVIVLSSLLCLSPKFKVFLHSFLIHFDILNFLFCFFCLKVKKIH